MVHHEAPPFMPRNRCMSCDTTTLPTASSALLFYPSTQKRDMFEWIQASESELTLPNHAIVAWGHVCYTCLQPLLHNTIRTNFHDNLRKTLDSKFRSKNARIILEYLA